MLIERYNPSKHYEKLSECLNKRGINYSLVEQDRPELGYTVSNKSGDILCAGFLLKIEGNSMMVESYITNPDYSPTLRDEALDALTHHIVESAKLMKIKRLIAFTEDNNTLLRAQRHGFVHLKQYQFIGREL